LSRMKKEHLTAVPDAGLSPRILWFYPGLLLVGFVANKWQWDEFFFSVTSIFPLSVSFHKYPILISFITAVSI